MTNQSNEKSKNGKRLALILLALLLIAAIAFGAYTYSKYVTNQKGTGSATVAKWGYTVEASASGNNGFYHSYNNKGVADGSGVAVVSSSDVVAPGTSGSITFTISGSSEVLAKVVGSFTATSDVSLTVEEGKVYYPIKYTLTVTEGAEPTSITGNLKEIETQFASKMGTVISANTTVEYTYTLSWEWAFENNDFNNIDADLLDTALGQIASGTEVSATSVNGKTPTAASTTVTFTFSIGLEQIQEQA